MNRNQKIIVAVLTAVILAILGNILFGNKSGKLPDKQEGKNIKYLLALEAENKDHELWISTYGRVITSLETDLSAEVGGRLLAGNVSLRPGTSFQKGDLLFKVFSDDFKYQIKAKRSNFIQLIAGTLPDLQVDLPNSLSKWNSFYESINVNRDLPPLPEVNDSKELTYLASRNVLTEYYNIKSDEERLTKYEVRAPFAGSILSVSAVQGATVNPGTPIIRVIKTGEVEVESPVSVENARRIKHGTKVKLYTREGRHFSDGKVIRISETVNPNTQSVMAYLSVDEKNKNEMYAGQYYDIEIAAGSTASSIVVPRRALISNRTVHIIKDSSLVQSEVDVVFSDDDSSVIRGVENGALIVIEPVEFIGKQTTVAPIFAR
ncbi:MAG TPA: hypothetical protein DDX92_11945 [Flavobacteriales bacterium]|jgi:membrane fusion protein (multidrug efflux system)|nr:hypothetical protein [Flavobacteriales bacterium]